MIDVTSPTRVTRTGSTARILSWAKFAAGLGVTWKWPRYSLTDVFTSTRLLQYRTSPLAAPLAVMIPVQGNAALTAGDVLSYGRGTQVSGNNYDTANPNQGTRIALFEPLYAGNDGLSHEVWVAGSLSGPNKPASNVLNSAFQSTEAGAINTAVTWALLARQLVIARFDADNVVGGAYYLDQWLNGVQTTSGPTSPQSPVAPNGVAYLGSNNGANAGHLLYAACDLDYVLSAAEVTALGTGTAPVSPDRVLLHPEAIKFLWVPGARAASGNLTTGANANEACFWNKRAYNVSTNPAGNLAVNGGFEAALGAEYVVTTGCVRDTTAADLAGLFDTACLKVVTTAADGDAYQIISAAAGADLYVSVFAKAGTCTNARLRVWSGASGDETTLLLDTTTTSATAVKLSGCVEVGAGHDAIRVKLTGTRSATADEAAYFDNLDVHLNLANNGGMEGTYAKTGTAITTSTAVSTLYDQDATLVASGETAAGVAKVATVATGAMLEITGTDLSPYASTATHSFLVVLYSASGAALAYTGAAGGGLTLGGNLFLTPDFAADTNWIKDAPWSIAGGKATKAGTGAGTINQVVGAANCLYSYSIDVTDLAAAQLYLQAGTEATAYNLVVTGVATYTGYATAIITGRLGFYGTAAASLSVDNASVQRVTDVPVTALSLRNAPQLGGAQSLIGTVGTFNPNAVTSYKIYKLTPTITGAVAAHTGTIAAKAAKLSTVAGTAFADSGVSDFAVHADGTSLLKLVDPADKVAWGWLKAAGGGETLDATNIIESWTNGAAGAAYDTFTSAASPDIAQAVSDGDPTDRNAASNAAVTAIGKLYKVVATLTLTSGQALTLSGTNGFPTTVLSAGANTVYFTATGTTCTLTIANTLATDFACTFVVKQVTVPSATGATIVSLRSGTTYNWTDIDTGFDPNAELDYTIYTFTATAGHQVIDLTAWDLSLAVVGMIAENSAGKYGFATTVTDASDLVVVDGWVDAVPADGTACAIYSALAPGWTLISGRSYRATGATGTYAQGHVTSAGSQVINQNVTTVSGQWYFASAKLKKVAGVGAQLQIIDGGGVNPYNSTTAVAFTHVGLAFRAASTITTIRLIPSSISTVEADDIAVIPLSSVTLTATPATDAASQEADGVTQDGGDTLTIPATGNLDVDAGTIAMRFTPRGWSGADGRLHVLFDTDVSGTNRLTVSKTAANALDITVIDAAGGTKSKRLTVTNLTLVDGTAQTVVVRWDAGTLTGRFNGTAFDTNSGAGTGVLGAVGTYLWFCSSNAGVSQADVTEQQWLISERALTDAECAAVEASL